MKYSCLSLIRISRGQDFCSNYGEIRIIESILQEFLKNDDFKYVPIRERFVLQRFGLERFNCTTKSTNYSPTYAFDFLTILFLQVGANCEEYSPCSIGNITTGYCEDICEAPGYQCKCLPGYSGNRCQVNETVVKAESKCIVIWILTILLSDGDTYGPLD